MSKKQQMRSSTKGIIVVISVIGGLALVVIIAAIVVMIFVTGPLMTNSQETYQANTTEKNNAIQNQAIQEKNPSLCDQISGETSVSMPLPGGNKVKTYDEATSKQRCKQQAEAGQPFVY